MALSAILAPVIASPAIYALAIAVPCQTPVPIVPSVVIEVVPTVAKVSNLEPSADKSRPSTVCVPAIVRLPES